MSVFSTMVGSAKNCVSVTARRFAGGRHIAIAAAGAAPLAGTSLASAHDRDRDRDRHSHLDLGIAVLPAPSCQPVYEDREVKVWVPAVYRTVCDHVWVEPVCRAVCERVWVPEVVQTREVRHRDGYRTWITCEHVVLCPGHFENRDTQQVVTPGHFEDVQRQEARL